MTYKINHLFKIARESQSMTQQEIAQRCGIARSSLSEFEAGRFNFSEKILVKISALLKINPEFAKNQSSALFKSKDLIKMYIKENLVFHSLEPLHTIMKFGEQIELIFLVISFRKVLPKARYSPGEPVYAVVVRDVINDVLFLLRMKKRDDLILLAGNGTQALNRIVDISEVDKKVISFSQQKIDEELENKIKDWAIERKDLEFLFRDRRFLKYIEPTEDEVRTIRAIRDMNIGPISKIELLILKELREKRGNTDAIISWIETLENK